MEYEIIGYYKYQDAEVLDTAPNKKEAIRLVQEYRMAFGNDLSIKYKRK